MQYSQNTVMTYDELEQLVEKRESLELLVLWRLSAFSEPVYGAELVLGERQKTVDRLVELWLDDLEEAIPKGKLTKSQWALLLGSEKPRVRSVAMRCSANPENWRDEAPED